MVLKNYFQDEPSSRNYFTAFMTLAGNLSDQYVKGMLFFLVRFALEPTPERAALLYRFHMTTDQRR